MKKIYSERQVNKNGLIPLIYKENINELIDKVNKIEGILKDDMIRYGLIKEYTDFALYYEPLEDGRDCFVMRSYENNVVIGVFPEVSGSINEQTTTKKTD